MRLERGVLFAAFTALFSFRLLFDLPSIYFHYLELLAIPFVAAMIFFPSIAIVLKKSSVRLRVSRLELYIIFLMLFLPLHSALRAQVVFSQPVVYGLLTQRSIFLLLFVVLLAVGLRQRAVTLVQVTKALVFLSWVWLIIYAGMSFFVDPVIFADKFPMLVGGGEANGYVYKFESVIVVFGGFYFLFDGVINHRKNSYFYSLVFITFSIFVLDKRSLTVSIVVSLCVVVWLFFNRTKKIKLFLLVGAAIVSGYLVLSLLYVDEFERIKERYLSAFSVVLSGQEIGDDSSNARVIETAIALPYIKENLALGNGDISNQWGGFEKIFGYFYPSDIGFLGGVFVYGLVGVLFYYLQYVFLVKGVRGVAGVQDNVMWCACYSMVITLFVQSFVRGGLYFMPSYSLYFIVLIEFMRRDAKGS